MTITITTQKGEQRQVEAESTCSPHFVIHCTLLPEAGRQSSLFTVTHLPSAFSVLTNIKGKRKAKLCAAVFAGLPVAWDRITDAGESCREAFKAMPAWVYEWRRQVNA